MLFSTPAIAVLLAATAAINALPVVERGLDMYDMPPTLTARGRPALNVVSGQGTQSPNPPGPKPSGKHKRSIEEHDDEPTLASRGRVIITVQGTQPPKPRPKRSLEEDDDDEPALGARGRPDHPVLPWLKPKPTGQHGGGCIGGGCVIQRGSEEDAPALGTRGRTDIIKKPSSAGGTAKPKP